MVGVPPGISPGYHGGYTPSLPWSSHTTLGIPTVLPHPAGSLHVTDLSVHGAGETAWAQRRRFTLGERPLRVLRSSFV